MYSLHKSEATVLDMPARIINVFVGSDKLSSDRMTVGLAEVHPAPREHARRVRLLHQERDHAAGRAAGLLPRVHPHRHAEGVPEPSHLPPGRTVDQAARSEPDDVARRAAPRS